MSLIDKIRQPISAEMRIFKSIFAEALKTENPLLSNVNEYILQGSGKQLRPILTILSAKLCGEVTEATYNGALSLELLHNASLIHDDVVDFTMERRGRSSINARWTNKIDVLSGDYMLSSALINATKTKNLDILFAVANIGMELSDGELIQLTNTKKTKITEDDYFKVIRKKTALLFGTCAEVGAFSVNASAEVKNHLKSFGENLGICFQIKDDIFDYFDNKEIGKPTGNDMLEGKLTLPALYVLNTTKNEEAQEIAIKVKEGTATLDEIAHLISFIKENGGIEYAVQTMNVYKQKAFNLLASLPDSDICAALRAYLDYVVDREK